MDFESIESILRKNSKNQIQIQILGIYDLEHFFGKPKGFKKNMYVTCM